MVRVLGKTIFYSTVHAEERIPVSTGRWGMVCKCYRRWEVMTPAIPMYVHFTTGLPLMEAFKIPCLFPDSKYHFPWPCWLNNHENVCAMYIQLAINLQNVISVRCPLRLPSSIKLLQQPTEERMVSTFLTAYVCGINIVSRDRYA